MITHFLRATGHVILLSLLASSPSAARAQTVDCTFTRNPWSLLRHCAPALLPYGHGDIDLATAFEHSYATLKSPETLNAALGGTAGHSGAAGLIGDLHLRFVNLHQGDDSGLGLAWDWARPLAHTGHLQGHTHWGFTAALESRGLVAAETDEHPKDFLENGVAGHLFFGSGGELDPEFLASHMEAVGALIASWESGSQLLPPPSLDELMGVLWDSLSTQVFITAGPEARLESDQAFSHVQWALGGRVGFDVKAWRPTSPLAKLNVVDWPAALVRFLTGTDDSFLPSGTAIPTLTLAYHRVYIDEHPTRAEVTSLDRHNRFEVRTAYRSRLARASTGNLWLTAELRHFLEHDPPGAVERAELHRFNHLHVVLEGPGGFAVSWATGDLPTDVRGDDHYGVGFNLRF